MAIRIRQVSGMTVALCAAETDALPGDLYLDDGIHHALSTKFGLDWQLMGFLNHPPVDPDLVCRMETQKVRDAKTALEEWLREHCEFPIEKKEPMPPTNENVPVSLFAVTTGSKELFPITDLSKLSDGYHTFEELYEHRNVLFLALMKTMPGLAWFSSRHHDGTEYEGWFIAGISLPTGDVTYHLPVRMGDQALCTGAKFIPRAPAWDGHTSHDVLSRLLRFSASLPAREPKNP